MIHATLHSTPHTLRLVHGVASLSLHSPIYKYGGSESVSPPSILAKKDIQHIAPVCGI